MSKSTNRRPQSPKSRSKKTSFESYGERRIRAGVTTRAPKHRNHAFDF